MVFNSITDLIGDDIIDIVARPGSPPYLGSTSSSVCSSPGPCGGCTSGLPLPMSFFTSGQQADAKLAPRPFVRTSEQQYQAMVQSLRERCELQELEMQRLTEKTQEAMALAAAEAAKARAAEEIIKSLRAQMVDIAKRLPHGTYDAKDMIPAYYSQNGLESIGVIYPKDANSMSSSVLASSTEIDGAEDCHLGEVGLPNGEDVNAENNGNGTSTIDDGKDGEGSITSRNSTLPDNCKKVDTEWIEQYQPGVYITLVAFQDGTRDLKRVRFSRRRFSELQCETWWLENRQRVYERYNISSRPNGFRSDNP